MINEVSRKSCQSDGLEKAADSGLMNGSGRNKSAPEAKPDASKPKKFRWLYVYWYISFVISLGG